MSNFAVSEATKQCTKCGESKNLHEFHIVTCHPDGLAYCCKLCARAAAKRNAIKRREAMGDEEWLRRNRAATRKTRILHGTESNREQVRAYTRATAALRGLHRTEFDHLYLLAKRGES